MLYACYENNLSPFESWNYFKADFSIYNCKNLYFVNDGVLVGCPKLGHAKLLRHDRRLSGEGLKCQVLMADR